MAEIYKQQVEHNATGGAFLREPRYKDYFTQGLNNVAEGLDKLGDYFQYRDDKDLASNMELVAQEVAAEAAHWQDFSAEGVNAYMSISMSKWDSAMANAPYDAQNRFNTYNPEARKIFELKTKEAFLENARKFVFAETKRDFNVIADDISEIKDPNKIKAATLAALDKVNSNKSGLLNVSDLSQLTDDLGYKIAIQSIGQAIIDGRADDAATLLNDKVFSKFLGPDDTFSFKQRIKNLTEAKAATKKAAPEADERAQFLVALRDGMYQMFGPDENIDITMNRITENLRSGQAIGDQKVLDWIDGIGIPLRDVAKKVGIGEEALNYWDSTPMTTRQLAIDKYEKSVLPALPREYRRKQSYLAQSFTRGLEKYLTDDGDFTKITNDELLDKMKDAEELQLFRIGLDETVLKQLDSFLNAVQAKKAEAGKAVSIELDPVQQNMAGFTAGKTFYGGGNLTEAMVRAQQEGEDRPSVIDGMLKNTSKVRDIETEEKIDTGLTKILKAVRSITPIGKLLGSGDLAPTRSNLPYFDDGGKEMSNSIAAGVGRLMQSLGEVDEDGDLSAPKANTRRFMTYAIPLVLGYISVKGNEDDLTKTGIKQGVINDENVVDLVLTMQDKYRLALGDTITAQDTFGVLRDTPGPSAPEVYGIKNSDVYKMLMFAYNIAMEKGMVQENFKPDQNAMINVAFALNTLVKDKKPKTYVPASDSGAKKRMDYKTKAMQQFEKITKRGK